MREELSMAPGAQHSGVLTLSNDAEESVRVTGELLDFYLDAAATPQFGRYAQESAYSCRQWMTINPVEIELSGKSHVQVRYTIRAPQTPAERSYHCAVGFTTRAAGGSTANGNGLRTAVQIVSALYVVVGKPAIQGTVKDLRLEYVPASRESASLESSWRAVLVFENSGLMHYRPSGDVDVLDAAGSVVETVKLTPLPVLPKRDQNLLVPLKLAGGPGKYRLRARIDLGGDEIQEATANVEATPNVVGQKPAQ
jgi:hypothetical protein